MTPTSDRFDWRGLWRSGDLSRFGFICFGIFLHASGETFFATITPVVLKSIGGAALIAWTLALYMVGSIVGSAASGFLTAKSGLRITMPVAAGIYAVGCAVCALAPQMEVLLLGRLLQGLGGGGLVALVFVSVERLFPRGIWPQLMGLISIAWGTFAFTGPFIGGLFGELGMWREAFWSFAAMAVLFLSGSFVVVGRTSLRSANRADAVSFPLSRLTVLAGAIAVIAGAGIDPELITSVALVAAGVGGLVLFFWLDAARPKTRLFPTKPLDPRGPVGTGLLMILCLSISTVSFWLYGPVLLNTLHGISLIVAGYIAVAESIAWSLAAIIVANAPPAAEKHVIRLGALTIVISLLVLTQSLPSGWIGVTAGAVICQGAGFGCLWGFTMRRIVEAAADDQQTITTSAIPTVQRLGYAIGASLSGIVANVAGFSEGLNISAARQVAFWGFAAFVPIALIGFANAWRLTSSAKWAPAVQSPTRAITETEKSP